VGGTLFHIFVLREIIFVMTMTKIFSITIENIFYHHDKNIFVMTQQILSSPLQKFSSPQQKIFSIITQHHHHS